MKTGEYFQRAKNLFIAACDLHPEDRAAFLQEACGQEHELQSRVEKLLAAEESSVLRTPAHRANGTRDSKPDSIEGYRLVAKIGDGGMGEVWEAEQEGQIHRRVAIKLIRSGMDSEQVIARFESERQSLAVMDHQNIARVFEAGSTKNGRPYFAMEYVEGSPITEYCDTNRYSVCDRLKLFVRVCNAVQHAHQKGVIHRDLKPANILVTDSGGEPEPKIIDFGIAKAVDRRLTEHSAFTEFGQWIGTPEYMSPEQTTIPEQDVDTRADVYSLGVVLYELLVGSQPLCPTELREAGFDEMRRKIREVEPPRPSTKAETTAAGPDTVATRRNTTVVGLVRSLRGDLDWLTMKALEKDRDRRYSSPAELAHEIERYLRHEPVDAGPPSQWYKLRKFVRRNRISVAASMLVVVALASGLAIASAGLIRAKHSERAASIQAEKALRVTDFLESFFDSMGSGDRASGALPTRNLLENGASKLDDMFPDEPEVRARMMATIGRVSARFGHYDLSASLLADASALQRELLGSWDPVLANSLGTLAWSAYWMGDRNLALSAAEESTSILEHQHGLEDSRTLSATSTLGFFLSENGQHDRAQKILEDALETATSSPSADRATIASLSLALGEHYLRTNETEKAGRLFETAVDLRAEEFGADGSAYAWALYYLGRYYTDAGRLLEANSCFETVLEIHNQNLDPDHPVVAITVGTQAFVSYLQGDIEAATRKFEIATQALRHHFGSDHHNLIWLTRGLAMCHRSAGDLERATSLAQESLRIAELVYGTSHLEYADTVLTLAAIQYKSGNFQEAHDIYRESFEIQERILGSEAARLEIILYNMACMSALDGQTQRAMDELRESIDRGFADPIIFDDPDLDVLRGNRDFKRMIHEVKQRNQAVSEG